MSAPGIAGRYCVAMRTACEVDRLLDGERVLENAASVVEGPRVIAAGRGITTTGGHGFEVGRIADGPDEVRKAVREQVHAGARVIKLFSTGGILGGGTPPEVSQYTPTRRPPLSRKRIAPV